MGKEKLSCWEEEQRICDLAEILLNTLIERQVNYGDTLRVLDVVKHTLELSVRDTKVGETLKCRAPMNTELPKTSEVERWKKIT